MSDQRRTQTLISMHNNPQLDFSENLQNELVNLCVGSLKSPTMRVVKEKRVRHPKKQHYRYEKNTKVAQWLDEQTERIHKNLQLNKNEQEQQRLLQDANLDKLKSAGLVQTVVSQR